METFYQCYLSRLRDLHEDMERAIAGLPQEALDWVPGPDMNTLAVLVVHICGAQRYWLGEVVAGKPSGRDRETEFRTKALDAGILLQRIHDALDQAQGVLDLLSLQDLADVRTSRNNKQVTVGWVLAHVMAHTALHVGHIELTRQLWSQNH